MLRAKILSPLGRRPIVRLWSALAFSAIGDQLYVVALGWVAVDLLGPAAGYLSAARAAVILTSVLLGGGLADGWSRRWSMIGADLTRAAALLILVGVWIAGHGPTATLLGLSVVVLAVGEAVFEPALQTLLPLLVPDRRLLVAVNGLFDATDRLARLLGPGLIALAGTLIPVVHFFSLDAASFLVSGLAVASLRSIAEPREAPATGRSLAFRHSLRRGLGALRAQPLLSYALDIKSVTNGVWYAIFFLVLPLAISRGGFAASGGAELGAYGLIIACYGISNLAANLVVGSRPLSERPGRLVFTGVLVTGIGIALMALACGAPLPPAWRLPALAAAACLSGFGGPLQDITLATLRQTLIAPEEIAAATRVLLAAASAGVLLAMLAAPALVGLLGAVPVMALGGAIYVLCAAAAWLRPALR
ncbi:MAG: MFS transporter [Hyphomicrobiales bacterium]